MSWFGSKACEICGCDLKAKSYNVTVNGKEFVACPKCAEKIQAKASRSAVDKLLESPETFTAPATKRPVGCGQSCAVIFIALFGFAYLFGQGSHSTPSSPPTPSAQPNTKFSEKPAQVQQPKPPTMPGAHVSVGDPVDKLLATYGQPLEIISTGENAVYRYKTISYLVNKKGLIVGVMAK